MPKSLTLRHIANLTFFTILIGSLVVGSLLSLLLKEYEQIIANEQLSKSAYETLFVLKYDTERLLTTADLDHQKKTILESKHEFVKKFDALSPYISDKKEWFKFKNIIISELDKVQVLLADDVFSKQNMMEKSLLRRLGEGLNANENSAYYIKIRDINSRIVFLKQYEDFLIDELYTFQRDNSVEAEKRIVQTKMILIWVIVVTFTLLIVLIFFVSRSIKKVENKLLGIQENLTNALVELEDKQKILVLQRDILDHSAHYDLLTGIPNRLHFVEKLNRLISDYSQSKKKFAVWFIDLDRFKEINDSFGHSIGDRVLQEVARRLEKTVNKESVARFGGDEFAIIIENPETIEEVEYVMQTFVAFLSEPMDADGYEIFISCSAGASFYPADAVNVEELLRNADSAMYQAKERGKNTYRFYTHELTQKVYERLIMENSLRKALKNHELMLHYQPQVDMAQNTIIGVEALIRWNNPEKGMIPPGTFIPIAEETGLIISIGEWVIEEACRQMMCWKSEGIDIGYIAVNISAKQLIHGNLEKTIPLILEKYNCKPEWIELELTESILMDDPEYSKIILNLLSKQGFKLAIDDFGTGYSSLAYLKNLPIHKLKIDKSFVDNLPMQIADCEIVKSTIHLCKGLKLSIVAEGIEQKEQGEFLLREGCGIAQGYYYYKPMAADVLEQNLRASL